MQYDWHILFDPAVETALALLLAVVITLSIRLLRRGHERSLPATAERLSAALDRIDIGVVLLNADTRAEFINRAFRDYFALPDDKADSKPPLIALMYHARDIHAYKLPDDEIDAFIARRVELIRTGQYTPTTLRMSNGRVLRVGCTALPDGGRMLSYTPVTDLIRHDDTVADRDYYLALRDGDVFGGGLQARCMRPNNAVPGGVTVLSPRPARSRRVAGRFPPSPTGCLQRSPSVAALTGAAFFGHIAGFARPGGIDITA
jgi:PAS domain-containing protein